MNYANKLFTDQYHEAYDYVSFYTCSKILGVLEDAGVVSDLQSAFTFRDLLKKTECIEPFYPTVQWALDYLLQQGFLQKQEDSYQLKEVRPLAKQTNWSKEIEASIQMIDYIAQYWASAINGMVSPLSLFFGNKGNGLWRRYFSKENGLYHVHNQWIGKYLGNIEKKSAVLEILELGAGFGSGTKEILDALNEHSGTDIRYYASDLSAVMGRHIRDIPNDKIETLIVNFDKPLSVQVEDRKFDYIVGINSLHCSVDPVMALKNVKGSLKPGGNLILSECIRDDVHPLLHQEFIFTLLPGYRQQKDGRHQIRGFYRSDQWIELFKAAGYQNVELDTSPGNKILGALIRGTRSC